MTDLSIRLLPHRHALPAALALENKHLPTLTWSHPGCCDFRGQTSRYAKIGFPADLLKIIY